MNDEILSRDLSTAVVQPEGDLVAAKLPGLRAKLRELAGSGILHLTMDLTRTQMVDSAGIGLPLLNFPLSRPIASGLHTIVPTF